ncbi:hypothetical protein [Pseudomonas fluorescens]|uniref:hypothetical protein n=1 Tax=Pseudomonas fluorescens TaxID=294 RepID=UPI001241933B|nr:hypothetical protein [Pseudomonas fluorescens]VVN47363.1 hypothetical protein PS639_05882 [Pseudomonas fluorescens]
MKNKVIEIPTWIFWVSTIILVFIVVVVVAKATGGWPRLEGFIEKSGAAWIQAIGSIAAILAASTIATRQVTHARELENERRIRSEIQRLEVIKALMARSRSLSGEVVDALKTRKPEDFEIVTPSMMRDTHQTLLLLPIFEIPNGLLALDVLTVGRALESLCNAWEMFCDEASTLQTFDTPTFQPLQVLAGEILQISSAAFDDCVKELRARTASIEHR